MAMALLGWAWMMGQPLPARCMPEPVVTGEIPLADYLALLQQISPAAGSAAQVYLHAHLARCGRPLTTRALRQAMAEGPGDPVLMSMIAASQRQDARVLQDLRGQVRCSRPEGDPSR